MNFQQQDNFLEAEEYYTLKSYVNKLSQSANIGIWEFDILKNPDHPEWSSVNVAELLGYNSNTPFNYNYFLTQLVHEADRQAVFHFFDSDVKHTPHIEIEARLLTKNHGYRWFAITGSAWWNEHGILTQISGIIFNIDSRKRADMVQNNDASFLNATSELLEAGGWETNLVTGAIVWTSEMYRILEAPAHFKPDAENIKRFYHPDFSAELQAALKTAVETRSPFDMETCMITAKNNTVWVQMKGYPVCDNRGKCTLIRGSMQIINNLTNVDLLNTNRQLTEQNKRLQNFAHIVSHNLRSYSNNLGAMIEMMHHPNMSPEEIKECMNHIEAISAGLTNTVNHLTEIVKQQDDAGRKRVPLSFKETLDNITSALQNDLNAANAHITTDFKAPVVNYLPAYMDSILLNMITNAIKYRHPERDLQLHLGTYERNGNIFMTIEDNGLGIDLAKHKNSMFGMYKTFHQHPDSRGLGLFMTRNQIETLGGSIDVESEPNVGTKFTIKLV